MVKVSIKYNNLDSIIGFNITGHANYRTRGKDIVCAAVSSLAQGTLTGLLDVLKLEIDYSIKDGFVNCNLLDDIGSSDMEKAQILLKTLELSLKAIQKDYGKYICVTQTKEV